MRIIALKKERRDRNESRFLLSARRIPITAASFSAEERSRLRHIFREELPKDSQLKTLGAPKSRKTRKTERR